MDSALEERQERVFPGGAIGDGLDGVKAHDGLAPIPED